MRSGIIGLSGSGKSTIFEALTSNAVNASNKNESRVNAVTVPDKRVDILSGIYNPKKTIYAQVEYVLFGLQSHNKEKLQEQNMSAARNCDAFIHVIKNFSGFGVDNSSPYKDFHALDQELMLTDLTVIEKRLERLELDKQRNKKIDSKEFLLLNECMKSLENEIPLRKNNDIAHNSTLKGYAFMSAKPMLILFNNDDEDESFPDVKNLTSTENCLVIRGKIEQELAQMSDEETEEFLKEFNIKSSAMDRVIKQTYDLLGLISFFTVGDDEVRAWTVKKDITALDAAQVIHSDIKKGFIRAEILSYDDLMEYKTYPEARKKGRVRLEGKTYKVQDGDIINFRFNV